MRRWVVLIVLVGLLSVRSEAAPQDPFRVSASVNADGTGWVATVRFAVPPRHHLYADQIRVREPGGLTLVPVGEVKPSRVHDALMGDDRDVYTNDFSLSYQIGAPAMTGVTLRVDYQGCDEATCFFPQTRLFPLTLGAAVLSNATPDRGSAAASVGDWTAFDAALQIAGRAVGYLRPTEFRSFLNHTRLGHGVSEAIAPSRWARTRETLALFNASPVEFLRRFGAAWTIALILLGGLFLNLTPCVLPMIPVNLAILGVGAQGSSRARGFGLGAAYGAGIAVVYGVLGLVVVLSGSQFGALNSMPGFNAAIAVLFLLLGLAMFDVIQIDLTRFQGGGGAPSRRGSYAAAVGMGGVAALLAGACVAPVVIAVLLLSGSLYAAGATVGLALPFVLGLGMGLPWPLAGAGLAWMPRPGPWMSWVKYGFGVFIMALALYYASVAVRGWNGSHRAETTDDGVLHLSADRGPVAWAAVMTQAHASGKPVFVDFWATWCKNCEAMEASTFRKTDVRKDLTEFVVVKCQAERPNDAATRATLEHFGVKGLPTYVVLKPIAVDARTGAP